MTTTDTTPALPAEYLDPASPLFVPAELRPHYTITDRRDLWAGHGGGREATAKVRALAQTRPRMVRTGRHGGPPVNTQEAGPLLEARGGVDEGRLMRDELDRIKANDEHEYAAWCHALDMVEAARRKATDDERRRGDALRRARRLCAVCGEEALPDPSRVPNPVAVGLAVRLVASTRLGEPDVLACPPCAAAVRGVETERALRDRRALAERYLDRGALAERYVDRAAAQ